MFERHRNGIKIFLITGLILAVLVALALFSLVFIILDQPMPATSLPATPTSTPQPVQPTQVTYPTKTPPTAIPTYASSPAPTTQPLPSPLPPPVGNGSKLGVHGIWSNRILDFTQTLADAGAPFRIVKAVGDLGWLKDVKRISPETITVGRLAHDHEGAFLVNDPGTDLDWYAAVLMEPILTKVQNDPSLRQAVDYWEVTNEPLGGGVPTDAYVRLARLTIKCLDIAEANDLKLAIFGFSAGTPEWVDLLNIVETGVFARAKSGGHILTLHEGVFGDDPIDMWWNVHFVDEGGNTTTEDTGVTAPGGWIPGGPILDGAGALCLRYRFLYHLLKERNEVVPLFVSEFYAGGGYDPVNKAEVVARMQWYDGHLGTDDYVLGFAPFTLGPVPDWTHQDYEPFYEGEDGLVSYMITMR
ncbi:MAG: hypothetical protein SWK90_08420 [Chloroflexota bacterium]|nr:hypothetical protein [Chloroflexota bacterium]